MTVGYYQAKHTSEAVIRLGVSFAVINGYLVDVKKVKGIYGQDYGQELYPAMSMD
jgi:hypothetical protein